MPSVYDVKPRFQALLRPLLPRLARLGISPNTLTLLAAAGSLAVGAAVAFVGLAALALVPVWLLARMALNALDGMMARELSMKTSLGAVLNETGDVVSDLALYLPLAVVAPAALWPCVLFASGAVLTELCGILAQALGAGRQYQGPMGKSDRALFVGALALATVIAPAAVVAWPWALGAGAALTVVTCANRCRPALRART